MKKDEHWLHWQRFVRTLQLGVTLATNLAGGATLKIINYLDGVDHHHHHHHDCDENDKKKCDALEMINNVDDEDNPVQQNSHILPRFPLPYVLE